MLFVFLIYLHITVVLLYETGPINAYLVITVDNDGLVL